MMRWLFIASALTLCSFSFAHKHDSIGTRVKNGKVYIIHKVEKGDGLYSLSKRYNVPLTDLIKENPGSAEVIKLGQLIAVPTSKKAVLEQKVVKDYFNEPRITDKPKVNPNPTKQDVSTFAKYHTVKAGETIYSIARLYNTKQSLIMSLNNLENTTLSLGQKLLVHDGKAVTKTVDVEKDLENVKEKLDEDKYKEKGFDTDVTTESQASTSGYTRKVEKLIDYNIEKVEENGTGVVGDAKLPSDKNFALQHDAPVGTVIMVTNQENQKSIFVKVTGNFFRSHSSSTIIKLSQESAGEIGLVKDQKVLLSYAR